jgi:hypothetical protein
MGSKDRLAFCSALLMIVATAASFCFDQVQGRPIERRRALSDLIPQSMMPSADLPLVDIDLPPEFRTVLRWKILI